MCVYMLVFGGVLFYIIYIIPSVASYTNILHSKDGNGGKKRSLCDIFTHTLCNI